MSIIVLPYSFTPGTIIASAQVNADFAAITSVVNGNLDSTNFATVFTTLKLNANNGTGAIAGGLVFQWGTTNNVPFDNTGSGITVTFNTAFPTTCMGVWTQVDQNTQSNAQAVTSFPNSISATQFVLNALGGTSGRNGTITWLALGW